MEKKPKIVTVHCVHKTEFSDGMWTRGRYWPLGQTVVEVIDQDEDDSRDRSKIGRKTYAALVECSRPSTFGGMQKDADGKIVDYGYPFPRLIGGLDVEVKTKGAVSTFGPATPTQLPARCVLSEGGELPVAPATPEDEVADLRARLADMEKKFSGMLEQLDVRSSRGK